MCVAARRLWAAAASVTNFGPYSVSVYNIAKPQNLLASLFCLLRASTHGFHCFSTGSKRQISNIPLPILNARLLFFQCPFQTSYPFFQNPPQTSHRHHFSAHSFSSHFKSYPHLRSLEIKSSSIIITHPMSISPLTQNRRYCRSKRSHSIFVLF